MTDRNVVAGALIRFLTTVMAFGARGRPGEVDREGPDRSGAAAGPAAAAGSRVAPPRVRSVRRGGRHRTLAFLELP